MRDGWDEIYAAGKARAEKAITEKVEAQPTVEAAA